MTASALIPMKGFPHAKQRLAPLLGPSERAALAEAMFLDTTIQALQARGLDAVFIVTSDEKVSRLAASLGAGVILEPEERGETAAVHFALALLKREGTETALVIPADIPLVLASDLELLLNEAPGQPGVLLVPSRDEMGTNALLLSPPDVIRLRFGHGSFRHHLGAAAANARKPKVIFNERIALDIDEPKDLRRFLSTTGGGETRRRLLAMKIPDKALASNSQSQ